MNRDLNVFAYSLWMYCDYRTITVKSIKVIIQKPWALMCFWARQMKDYRASELVKDTDDKLKICTFQHPPSTLEHSPISWHANTPNLHVPYFHYDLSRCLLFNNLVLIAFKLFPISVMAFELS